MSNPAASTVKKEAELARLRRELLQRILENEARRRLAPR